MEQARLLELQKNKCFYCGDEFGTYRQTNRGPRPVLIQWDHVRPFAYDGNNEDFVAACGECNRAKSSLHFETLRDAKKYLSQRMYEKKAEIRAKEMRSLPRDVPAQEEVAKVLHPSMPEGELGNPAPKIEPTTTCGTEGIK